MKKLIYFTALAVFILSACKSNENKQSGGGTDSITAPATTASKPDSTAKNTIYSCPMHPEVNSNSPGQCPKCGMDLQPKS